MGFKASFPLALVFTAAVGAAEPIRDDLLTAMGVQYETYMVRWWGAPGSEMTRPVYRVARFDTDAIQLHHGIVPGRDLINYTMPYWNIRSYISFVDAPAELAQDIEISHQDASGEQSTGFIPRSGVELAPWENALAVRIVNRTMDRPEDVTIVDQDEYEETNPLSLEKVFVLAKEASTVPVHCTFTNVSGQDLHNVLLSITFEQSFGWSAFGIAKNDAVVPVDAPDIGESRAFFAFSEGRDRGFSITVDEGIQLRYELEEDLNQWRVILSRSFETFAKGDAVTFSYAIESIEAFPDEVGLVPEPPEVAALDFERIQPTSFRTAPVNVDRRVTMRDALAAVARPKVRGLNLRGTMPRVLDDLDELKNWGGNLVITHLGAPDQTASYIEHAHALGMEVFLQGHGSFDDGAPNFETYYTEPRTVAQLPEAHGQDEDHHYWRGIEPALSFESLFEKPMAQASHDEMVLYWAKCYVAKWRGVQQSVAQHAPDAGVWFYAPVPSVAHYDPQDSYDLFLSTLVNGLGDDLTVFPFYYGIEYNQAEYMMRRWKENGAHRVVFLPMRDFMSKPSQFMRAITAARRGGADGTCGFGLSISDAPADKQWQWKSVLLGAWANFPTPELNAYSLLEEPAELVETLANSKVTVTVVDEIEAFDAAERLSPLLEMLPHIQSGSEPGRLTIAIADTPGLENMAEPGPLWSQHKGFVQMANETIRLSGMDESAVTAAVDLFLRFAQVAQDEFNRTNQLSRDQ